MMCSISMTLSEREFARVSLNCDCQGPERSWSGSYITQELRRFSLESGGARLVEPVLHLLVAYESGLLGDELAGVEDGEVGDATDVVAGGELRVLLGVDLEDEGAAGGVGGGLLDLGGGHAAGAAPVGPEVDEDGDAGVLDDLVEERGVGGDGLVDGRERVFAVAASAGVGEVVGRDTVLLSAVRTGGDEGHAWLLLIRGHFSSFGLRGVQRREDPAGCAGSSYWKRVGERLVGYLCGEGAASREDDCQAQQAGAEKRDGLGLGCDLYVEGGSADPGTSALADLFTVTLVPGAPSGSYSGAVFERLGAGTTAQGASRQTSVLRQIEIVRRTH